MKVIKTITAIGIPYDSEADAKYNAFYFSCAGDHLFDENVFFVYRAGKLFGEQFQNKLKRRIKRYQLHLELERIERWRRFIDRRSAVK